jgi:hypothetical protein
MQASIHLRDRDFGSGRGACWTAPEPEAAMNRLVLFAILFCGPAFARDDGRYSNSPLKEWFDRLASGKGLCCSFADGYVVEDPDWKSSNGNYQVRIDNQWVDVPDNAVVTEPAGRWCGRCGTAKV